MMVNPGLATLIGQAMIGCVVGNFLLIIARIVLVLEPSNDWFVFWLPPLLIFGLAIGTVAGLIIWLCGRAGSKSPKMTYRTVIGAAILAVAWFGIGLSLSGEVTPPTQLWLLGVIVVPAIGIGLVTNSRLRLWHELVRKGESVHTVPKIFAALTGLVLRPLTVFFFMCSLIVLIPAIQRAYYLGTAWLWCALVCGHFAGACAVLFSRLKTSLLFPLALIVNSPIVAALVQFRLSGPEIRYVAIPYLGVWAVFLLTRWRQTDAALAFLNEEIHYYLID